jgi:hypothetical protein
MRVKGWSGLVQVNIDLVLVGRGLFDENSCWPVLVRVGPIKP